MFSDLQEPVFFLINMVYGINLSLDVNQVLSREMGMVGLVHHNPEASSIPNVHSGSGSSTIVTTNVDGTVTIQYAVEGMGDIENAQGSGSTHLRMEQQDGNFDSSLFNLQVCPY